MEHAQVELIQTSHRDLAGRGPQIANRLYQRLFTRDPALRAKFPDDPSVFERKLAATLDLVSRNIGHVEAIESALLELGARHVRYGAEPVQYSMFAEELVGAMGDVVGASWTDETARAWTDALAEIARVMTRGWNAALGKQPAEKQ